MKLDALIRVSQSGGRAGEEFRSPEQQREICERWAASNGAEIVAWHEAIDVSGKTMARPDVDAVRARLHAKQTDGVIIAWLDRFSRAPIAEAMTVHDEITKAGGKVVACDMAGIDASDPTGEWMLTAMLATNRMQWRRLAERWSMSRRDAISAGKAMGGAPFGYRYADPSPRAHGRGVIDSRLVPDERHAAVVLELFERKAAGATWLELARWLDTAAPKPDGRRWARSSVSTIIQCETYLGQVRHGEHVHADAHDKLVTASLWRRAQNEPGRRTPRGKYLLSGLVHCAACGRRMQGSLRNGTRIYVCRYDGCPARSSVTTARLDAEVIERFFARLEDFHVRATDDAGIQEASEDVKRLTGEVERLAAIVPKHPAAVAAHQRALAEAESSLIEAEDRHAELAASLAQDGPNARELQADWPALTLAERREILRAGIDAALVRRASGHGVASRVSERVLVLFRGEAPSELAASRQPVTSWTWTDNAGSLRAAA